MIKEIYSPPIDDRGPASSAVMSELQRIAQEVASNPGYTEEGRSSLRIHFREEVAADTELHFLAEQVSRDYLGSPPGTGSTALISIVTDAEAYNARTKGQKAATNWHQDFVETEEGFFFAEPQARRLIIPILSGPLYALGKITIRDALQIKASTPRERLDRSAVLKSAPAVLGADGVLVKSEADPLGGTIVEAEPGRVYIIPRDSVHKTNPFMPEGRIFFQLDTTDAKESAVAA